MPISKGFKIHNFGQFHDINTALQTYLKNNLGPSSSTTPSKSSPFSILQGTFVEKELIESLVLQKFGIKGNMRVMISFSNVPNKVNNKTMIYNLIGSIQLYENLGRNI